LFPVLIGSGKTARYLGGFRPGWGFLSSGMLCSKQKFGVGRGSRIQCAVFKESQAFMLETVRKVFELSFEPSVSQKTVALPERLSIHSRL
jgi:hypothetical protein